MIVLAALLAAQLAPGCRRLERSILCALAPPIHIAPPASAPPAPAPIVARETPPLHRPHRSAARASARPAIAPAPPPTAADIAHRVASLVAIADCTGVRTYLASIGTAEGDGVYRACVGLPPAPSGRDLGAVPRETAPALGGTETVEHPQ